MGLFFDYVLAFNSSFGLFPALPAADADEDETDA